jgi:predicted nucleic acid-binding protein
MSAFLLDTNVISEFARPDNKPDPRGKQWLEAADPERQRRGKLPAQQAIFGHT